ncbi:uncharacterized protein LOC133524642 [Cydia pomonella]|uniref:uncharacterized protein LOC133524642 n=1 Tax=Cydia pomonella TaxID=82600 RepID=UPI002ADD786F|nr:uncharacterized protein LOC133524642 [Cydia pomonella]
MCICHYCSILGLFLGEILYAAQKLIQCLAIGSVFTCLMFSFTVILMLGVGLGYNHAYVEITGTRRPKLLRSENNESDADAIETRTVIPVEIPMYDYDEIRMKRSQNTSSNATTEDYPLSPTMVIPLRSKKNILQLLRKVKKQGKNVTLEIIAT